MGKKGRTRRCTETKASRRQKEEPGGKKETLARGWGMWLGEKKVSRGGEAGSRVTGLNRARPPFRQKEKTKTPSTSVANSAKKTSCIQLCKKIYPEKTAQKRTESLGRRGGKKRLKHSKSNPGGRPSPTIEGEKSIDLAEVSGREATQWTCSKCPCQAERPAKEKKVKDRSSGIITVTKEASLEEKNTKVNALAGVRCPQSKVFTLRKEHWERR